MKLTIQLKPGAKRSRVEPVDATHFKVWVHARPIEGEANRAMVEVLSDHFNTAKSNIRIVSGHATRTKIVEIS